MTTPSRKMGQIAVGTSGWSYDHWGGTFYPREVAKKRWFDYYTRCFSTVEINASFYGLPKETTIRSWYERAPRRFRFAMKGSRLITHARRLVGTEEAVRTFIERVEGLRSYLGVILWQLPPDLERDPDRLDRFLHQLPRRLRHAVEFRHSSWLTDEVFDLLRRRRVAHVSVSSREMPRDLTVTADFVYVRLHGLEGGYEHDYSTEELRPWADSLRQVAVDGKDGFVYFNNDGRARAPENAQQLVEMLGDTAVRWSSP